MKKSIANRIAIRAMLVAAAFVLSWVESIIPYPFPLPGFKIGLGNLVVLLALYNLSTLDALAINIVRILLVGFTFGNMYSLAYSLAGGFLSFLMMYLLKKYSLFNIKFVSVTGGIFHNVGQILMAMFVLKSIKILWYLPFLWLSGIVAGILVGLVCEMIIKRIPSPLLLVLLAAGITLSGCGKPFTLATATSQNSIQLFAMDTFMTIEADGQDSTQALSFASDEIKRLDDLWSVGLHNSEISQINDMSSAAKDEPFEFELSTDTADVLNRALEISEETDGALDLTVYPLMELWGFTSKDMKVPDTGDIKDCLSRVSYKNIELKETEGSAFISLHNNAKIDLGAVAKGYVTDRIVYAFKHYNITSANINLGGNVYVMGRKPNGALWNIAIENPDSNLTALKNAPYLGILSLEDKAVVTSGDYHRFFEEDEIKYHHIMDPTTGYPADKGLISVTIVSSDATLADALSTAIFVMGKEKGLSYQKAHKDLFDCILVEKDGSITVTAGLKDSFKSDLNYSFSE